jgi:hypothetical protein
MKKIGLEEIDFSTLPNTVGDRICRFIESGDFNTAEKITLRYLKADKKNIKGIRACRQALDLIYRGQIKTAIDHAMQFRYSDREFMGFSLHIAMVSYAVAMSNRMDLRVMV